MSEAPTTQERYAAATHSSSLCVSARTTGDVDHLMAAAWTKERFGAALMRLRAEFDSAGRRLPKKPSRLDVFHAARQSMGKGVSKVTRAGTEAAKKRLQATYDSEMLLLRQPLKTLAQVRRHLSIKLLLDGMPDAAVDQIIFRWLCPACPLCLGRGKQLEKWSDAELSSEDCRMCHGSGHALIPAGMDGMAAVEYMDACLGSAGRSMGSKTRAGS